MSLNFCTKEKQKLSVIILGFVFYIFNNLPGGMEVGVLGDMGEVTGWKGRSGLSCWKDSRLA